MRWHDRLGSPAEEFLHEKNYQGIRLVDQLANTEEYQRAISQLK